MDPRDLSFLLILTSYILWAAALLSVIFMERKDWASLPALYFIILLFYPPHRNNTFKFFCITSLTSILTFAWGVTKFLSFAARQ